MYLVYPQIGNEIGLYLQKNSFGAFDSNDSSIWRLLSAKLLLTDNQKEEKRRMLSAKLEGWCTL